MLYVNQKLGKVMKIYNEIIANINPILKQMGFVKMGSNFYVESNKNFGVINIQKSKESKKEVLKFTINIGVYSDVLGKLQYDYNYSIKPKLEQCQWLARIGFFMKDNPDFWWEINVSDDLNIIALNVIEIIQNIAIPEINKRINDEGLLNCWMNEAFAGTTEIGRFKYVTTLLKVKGDFHALKQVVETFMEKSKGSPSASIATDHLKNIEYYK